MVWYFFKMFIKLQKSGPYITGSVDWDWLNRINDKLMHQQLTGLFMFTHPMLYYDMMNETEDLRTVRR